MSVGSPQKHTTLQEYIRFLRKHNFIEDADFYENDVVAVLKKAGVLNPIDLTTREVMSLLYGIIDAAEQSQQSHNAWEVELVK